MRRVLSLLLVAFLLLGAAPAAAQDTDTTVEVIVHVGSAQATLVFDDDIPQNDEWVTLVTYALRLLPEQVQRGIGHVEIVIANDITCGHPRALGCVWGNTISMRRHADVPRGNYPYSDVHVAENGYGFTERIYVLLHELGHVYQASRTVYNHPEPWIYEIRHLSGSIAGYAEVAQACAAPTNYGDDADATRRNRPVESYAEDFALFILWGRYRERTCPAVYAFFANDVFGIEYETTLVMPESIRTRTVEAVLNTETLPPHWEQLPWIWQIILRSISR